MSGSQYQREPELGEGLRLHLNENTGGCSPAVLAALRSIGREEISLYPDYAAVTVAAAALRLSTIPTDWIPLLDSGETEDARSLPPA